MQVYELSLADRDNYLTQIEQQIQSKRNLLLEKRKTLEGSITVSYTHLRAHET